MAMCAAGPPKADFLVDFFRISHGIPPLNKKILLESGSDFIGICHLIFEKGQFGHTQLVQQGDGIVEMVTVLLDAVRI